MTAVRTQDILLRVGGRTLQRFGAVAVAGAGRGLIDYPYTFSRADASTCATYIDRDGILRLSAANKLRTEWVDLDGDGVRETPGILLEGSRINLQPHSDDVSTWTPSGGLPTATPNSTSLGALQLSLVVDNDAASAEGFVENCGAFTGDGIKAYSFFVAAPATPSDANSMRVRLYDVTAAAVRCGASFAWNSDGTLQTVTPDGGAAGTLIRFFKVGTALNGRPVYRVEMQTGTITAANTHRSEIFPAGFTVGNVGQVLVGGFQPENAAFPSSLIRTTGSAVTRAADSLTLPFNFGPMDISILLRVARPVWADASGDIGLYPTPLTLGGVNDPNKRIEISGVQGGRNWQSRFGDSGSEKTVAIPAGATLNLLTQCKNASTLPAVAVDAGSGLSAFDTGAPTFTVYADQTIRIPHTSAALYGVLLDLVIARGLFSLNEMLAVS